MAVVKESLWIFVSFALSDRLEKPLKSRTLAEKLSVRLRFAHCSIAERF